MKLLIGKFAASVLIASLFISLFCSFPVYATDNYDFPNFTEEDALAFVAAHDIDIPPKLLQTNRAGPFTLSAILQSYYEPCTVFCYNYYETQQYAENIRAAVNSYINFANIPTATSVAYYSLQYNTVMDENNNWVTSGGYYYEKWFNYNCYAYSINRAEQPGFYNTEWQYQPGDMSGAGNFSSCSSVYDLAEIIEADLEAMGYYNILISSTIPTVSSSQELICVRMNEDDYHFMKYDIETNAWYHKPSYTAVLKYNTVPSNDNLWYGEYSYRGSEHISSLVYDSDIVFIKYSKNQINVGNNAVSRKYIESNKDVFCEINIIHSTNHQIELNSNYSIEYEIYDKNFNIIDSGNGTDIEANVELSEGIYYLRVNFESYTGANYVDISINPHPYNYNYEQYSTTQHKAYCACGSYILQGHIIQNGLCNLCGVSHTHEYTEWEYYSQFLHVEKCFCGEIGTVKKVHAVRATDTGRYKQCVGCGYMVDTFNDMGQIESIGNMISVNGSYIDSNGIIILVDADIEAYLKGELVFFKDDDSLEAS